MGDLPLPRIQRLVQIERSGDQRQMTESLWRVS